jgi:hypothetical protein
MKTESKNKGGHAEHCAGGCTCPCDAIKEHGHFPWCTHTDTGIKAFTTKIRQAIVAYLDTREKRISTQEALDAREAIDHYLEVIKDKGLLDAKVTWHQIDRRMNEVGP